MFHTDSKNYDYILTLVNYNTSFFTGTSNPGNTVADAFNTLQTLASKSHVEKSSIASNFLYWAIEDTSVYTDEQYIGGCGMIVYAIASNTYTQSQLQIMTLDQLMNDLNGKCPTPIQGPLTYWTVFQNCVQNMNNGNCIYAPNNYDTTILNATPTSNIGAALYLNFNEDAIFFYPTLIDAPPNAVWCGMYVSKGNSYSGSTNFFTASGGIDGVGTDLNGNPAFRNPASVASSNWNQTIANQDITFYYLNAPDGYYAIGSILTNIAQQGAQTATFDPRESATLMCIRQDLVNSTAVSNNQVWNDQHSGNGTDILCFLGEKSKVMFLASQAQNSSSDGTFYGTTSLSFPDIK